MLRKLVEQCVAQRYTQLQCMKQSDRTITAARACKIMMVGYAHCLISCVGACLFNLLQKHEQELLTAYDKVAQLQQQLGDLEQESQQQQTALQGELARCVGEAPALWGPKEFPCQTALQRLVHQIDAACVCPTAACTSQLAVIYNSAVLQHSRLLGSVSFTTV